MDSSSTIYLTMSDTTFSEDTTTVDLPSSILQISEVLSSFVSEDPGPEYKAFIDAFPVQFAAARVVRGEFFAFSKPPSV
jgi:hypothetical protein